VTRRRLPRAPKRFDPHVAKAQRSQKQEDLHGDGGISGDEQASISRAMHLAINIRRENTLATLGYFVVGLATYVTTLVVYFGIVSLTDVYTSAYHVGGLPLNIGDVALDSGEAWLGLAVLGAVVVALNLIASTVERDLSVSPLQSAAEQWGRLIQLRTAARSAAIVSSVIGISTGVSLFDASIRNASLIDISAVLVSAYIVTSIAADTGRAFAARVQLGSGADDAHQARIEYLRSALGYWCAPPTRRPWTSLFVLALVSALIWELSGYLAGFGIVVDPRGELLAGLAANLILAALVSIALGTAMVFDLPVMFAFLAIMEITALFYKDYLLLNRLLEQGFSVDAFVGIVAEAIYNSLLFVAGLLWVFQRNWLFQETDLFPALTAVMRAIINVIVSAMKRRRRRSDEGSGFWRGWYLRAFRHDTLE
jgi:hypothetical protein